MFNWKLCSNGHYYEGDKCPYCEIANNPENDGATTCDTSETDRMSHTPLSNTLMCHSISLFGTGEIKVNSEEYFGIHCLQVYESVGEKIGYALYCGDSVEGFHIDIKDEDLIKIGKSALTGSELKKICDLIVDNKLSFITHRKFRTTIDMDFNNLTPLD